jgi:hypothetical protein
MKELQEKLTRWAMGVSLGMGLLVVLNFLQIPYYLLYPRTTLTVFISESYDYYAFLLSTLCVPWMFVASRRKFSTPVSVGVIAVWAVSFVLSVLNEWFAVVVLYAAVIFAFVFTVAQADTRRTVIKETLQSTLAIFALVEWSSLFYYVAAAFNPQAKFGILSQQLEANLTYSIYFLGIPIMLLLLFSWVWILLIWRLPKLSGRLIFRYQPSPQRPSIRVIAAALDLFAILAIIVFFYSYLAGQTWVVGVDSHWRYIDPLNGLAGLTPSQAFNTSVGHGVYVVFLYLIHLGMGLSSASIVKYAPLVLAFCTASAVFFATLRGGWSFQLATLTSVCTLLWLPTILGIYAGLQANWVALLFWMIFLAIYFANREPKLTTYVILAVLSLIILLVHPWTWGVFTTTLVLTAIISRRTSWARHCGWTLAASLILALPLGLAAYVLSYSLGHDFTQTIALYISAPLNPSGLLSFGGALVDLFSNWGPVLSPPILLLSLAGAYVLSRRRDIIANYLTAWIAAWCVGSILVAPSGFNPTNVGLSDTGLWRMLYISPLPFLLALGLEKCISLAKGPVASVSSQAIRFRAMPMLALAPSIAIGAGLFASWDPNVRLLLVAGALILTFLFVVVEPDLRTFDVLLVSVLVLLLFNAAFRTLFPLLLDPHNLFSSLGTSR